MSGVSEASQVQLRPIAGIAEKAGIQKDELELFGEYRAKVKLPLLRRLAGKADGKLVIVTAITPTKATQTSIIAWTRIAPRTVGRRFRTIHVAMAT